MKRVIFVLIIFVACNKYPERQLDYKKTVLTEENISETYYKYSESEECYNYRVCMWYKDKNPNWDSFQDPLMCNFESVSCVESNKAKKEEK